MMGPRTALASWALAGLVSGGAGSVAINDMAPADRPPAVSMAVAIRAACPALAGDVEKVATMVAIGLAESSGHADAIGDVDLENGEWGPSVGWWQVRSLWAQDGTGGERDRTRLTDPAFNATSACSISRGGTYLPPWTMYTNGEYKAHLSEAREAASTAMGVDVSAGAATALAATAASSSDCSPSGGHAFGAFLDRVWCNGVIGPWLALGKRPNMGAWWGKVDRWAFGPPKGVKGKPASLPTVAGATGLDATFAGNVARLVAAAPGPLSIKSGFRTVQDQLAVGGGDPDCGTLVACVRDGVCGSMHCAGLAVDLDYHGDSAVQVWAHEHARDYGLEFRMSWEPWHIEPEGAFAARHSGSA